jgi:NAD(P)-dependent dehydrogenase (short-subunit alcohol dehydrogenase family)
MSSYVNFLSRQLFITPQPADPTKYDLAGQCGLVTGSNSGLGFEAAKQLLALGLSTLILAVRNQERGEDARAKLAAEYPNANILVWIVDMASYESIQSFVARCDTLPRLDFAILNAGVVHFKFETNKLTGHEDTVQTNVLSTALLATLLFPVLANKSPTGPGKITIVGSEVAEWTNFKQKSQTPILPQLDVEKEYDGGDHYYVSKLLLQYFFIEAAKRIDSDKVILNLVNPGFCYGSVSCSRSYECSLVLTLDSRHCIVIFPASSARSSKALNVPSVALVRSVLVPLLRLP